MTTPLATFEVVTLFPEMFRSVLDGSLLGKALERGLVAVHFTDPRQWGLGKHRAVDDAPYGGGGGMVMRVDSLVSAIEHAEAERGPAHKILLGPAGPRLDRAAVERLCRMPRVLLVCGRYEGIDERVSAHVDEELSLGDFVMTGGEIAAMAIIDACARRLPGVLGNASSPVDESFEESLLEHPHYTRPPVFRDAPVPEILQSGDHDKVRRWRRQQSLIRTRTRRPNLFARHSPTVEDRALLQGPEQGPRPSGAPISRSSAGPSVPSSPNSSPPIAPPTGVPPVVAPIASLASSPATASSAPSTTPSDLAARSFVALCHHPVVDRAGAIITTAVTNLDIHDLARSSRTYGLAGLFLVTPIEAQRALCEGILGEWRADGLARNDHRMEALARVSVVAAIDDAVAEIERRTGSRPLLVATSARADLADAAAGRALDYPQFADAAGPARPVLILFGTGWGLANEVLDRVDRLLSPIRGAANYNHLSVRSAAAITLDRLFAERI